MGLRDYNKFQVCESTQHYKPIAAQTTKGRLTGFFVSCLHSLQWVLPGRKPVASVGWSSGFHTPKAHVGENTEVAGNKSGEFFLRCRLTALKLKHSLLTWRLFLQLTIWMPGWLNTFSCKPTTNPSGSLFSWDVNYGTGLDYRDVDNKIQSDVNNEVYTVLETSLLIQQKYRSFMFVQISLPWISSTCLSSQHLPPHMDPQSKVFNHFLPTPTMYIYVSFPFHSKNLRINNLPPPKQLAPQVTKTPLHSTVPSTSRGRMVVHGMGFWLVGEWLGWLVGWIGECLKKRTMMK